MQPRMALTVLFILVLMAAAFSVVQADETVIVPWGSFVRYAIYPEGSQIPPEVITLEYDDSEWAIGAAPFGTSSGDCPLQVATSWPVGTVLMIRLWIDLPPGSTHLVVEKRASFSWAGWYNGEDWGSITGGACPYGQGAMGVGYTYLPTRVLLVFAFERDRYYGHTWTYADFQVTVDLSSVDIELGTWGNIKSLFR